MSLATRRETWRLVLRWLLIAAYLYAGWLHVTRPQIFMPIMPDMIPYPREIVIFTGLCELAGAIGLMIPRLRWLAGLMLAIYAACVFPANIKHALYNVHVGNGTLGWWYHGPRLLLQPVIGWWALFAGGVVSWPFRKR